MKAVTIYEAGDGQRFNTADACAKYEELSRAVADVMSVLGPRPQLSHTGYKQQSRSACLAAKEALVHIARGRWPGDTVWQNPSDKIHVMGIAGRIASESGDACFALAWNRLCCINWENFREYGQPYFAMHPEEADA